VIVDFFVQRKLPTCGPQPARYRRRLRTDAATKGSQPHQMVDIRFAGSW